MRSIRVAIAALSLVITCVSSGFRSAAAADPPKDQELGLAGLLNYTFGNSNWTRGLTPEVFLGGERKIYTFKTPNRYLLFRYGPSVATPGAVEKPKDFSRALLLPGAVNAVASSSSGERTTIAASSCHTSELASRLFQAMATQLRINSG